MTKDLEKDNEGNYRVPGSGEVCEYVEEDNYVFKVCDEFRNFI